MRESRVSAVEDRIVLGSMTPIADSKLATDVLAALRTDAFLAPFAIGVNVDHGTVTLTGNVASGFERANADSVVASLRGVRAIKNELRIQRPWPVYSFDPYLDAFFPYVATEFFPPSTPKSDATIANDIATGMRADPFVPADHVHVTVLGGRATLTGTVNTWREKAAAAEDARQAGATAVDDRLEIGVR